MVQNVITYELVLVLVLVCAHAQRVDTVERLKMNKPETCFQ